MKSLSNKRRRDIGQQKWQFVAVVVTVAMGVAMFAGTFNAYLNLGTSLEASYDRLHMADMVVTGADEGFVDSVQGVSGVANAIERRQADVPFTIGDDDLLGRVIGFPGDAQPAIDQVDIDEGEYLDPDSPTDILLEKHAADNFELEVGDTLTITDIEVTVRGIVTSPEYLWPARDEQSLFTPPDTFAVVFALEETLDGLGPTIALDQVLVEYDDDVDRETVDNDVERAAAAANAGGTQVLADQPSNKAINEEISGLQSMAVAFPVLFLAAAGLAIYVIMTRLVFSQRGVIGTLRASGFGKRQLAKHYRSYGVFVGLVGAAIGALFGGLMARGMTALYTNIFSIPDLVARFHLPTVIVALAFGAIAGIIASIAPARLVMRLEPAEAMRGDVPAESGKESIFERLVPPLRNAPARWRMTLRGIGRNKKRSATQVIGVVLAMTLIIAAVGMLDTIIRVIDRQFDEVSLSDATAIYNVPVTPEAIDTVADVKDVAAAEPVMTLQASIENGAETFTTTISGYEAETVMHGFPEPLPRTGIVVGQAMSGVLDVELGDTVTVVLGQLDAEITTTIEGFVDEPLGTVAYMQLQTLIDSIVATNPDVDPALLTSPSYVTAEIRFENGANATSVMDRIQDLEIVATVIDETALRDAFADYQAFFYAFIGLMVVFGAALAFALIFNIISVNVAERSSEFASMRANGLSYRRVANMIAGETFLLTALGIVPGLLAGWWAANAFIKSFADEQMPITADVAPITFVVASASMFVVAGLSLIPALRAVKRINVGEIVRERSV